MRRAVKQALLRRWQAFLQTPFGCLCGLFLTRLSHGGAEPGAEDLDLGLGVALVLLAMPGLLVSLLMFEKYGSLILFLRGIASIDRFKGVFPDEYFFLVLSMVVTGTAALWCWDRVFLDARDYTNLLPLPISLRTIFFANLLATAALALLLAFVTNAASAVLFPVAVVGFQSSFAVFFRFALGHAATVVCASLFSFAVVFDTAGLLMTVLSPAAFRKISSFARFLIALWLLSLLASSVTVPSLLTQMSPANAHKMAMLPPVSFMGLARTLWGRGDPFVGKMTTVALFSVALALFVAILTYALSFRRAFVGMAELTSVSPLPRNRVSSSPFALIHKIILRTSLERAGYHFVARTLLRSDAHLQVLLSFSALGLVMTAEALSSTPKLGSLVGGTVPSVDILSIPFTLSYSIILGARLAFEVPADLRANWIFRFSLDPGQQEARAIARRVLLMCSVAWLGPLVFIFTLLFWGWTSAILHTAIWIAFSLLLVEILLIRFRKIPFTCSYPAFQSHSGLTAVAYLFGFFVFSNYIPEMERWSLTSPLQSIWFVPLLAACFAGLRKYRKQMLDMDKSLIFEESSSL